MDDIRSIVEAIQKFNTKHYLGCATWAMPQLECDCPLGLSKRLLEFLSHDDWRDVVLLQDKIEELTVERDSLRREVDEVKEKLDLTRRRLGALAHAPQTTGMASEG